MPEQQSQKDRLTTDLRQRTIHHSLTVAACAAIAGCISRTATAPFDRVRIVSAGTGITLGHAIRRVRGEGGVTAFWRGNLTNCIKIVPEQGIRMGGADVCKRMLSGKPENFTIGQRFACGALGGIVAQAAVYPLEVLRTQVATATRSTPSLVGCARRLYKAQGMRAFYRGIKPSLIGALPYNGFDIAFYESLRNSWERRKRARLRAWEMSATGAAASAGAQLLTYPLALVRTRMQAQAAEHVSTSMTSCVLQIARTGGVGGFYRGLAPNMAKMMPAAAIHWMCYDTLRHALLA